MKVDEKAGWSLTAVWFFLKLILFFWSVWIDFHSYCIILKSSKMKNLWVLLLIAAVSPHIVLSEIKYDIVSKDCNDAITENVRQECLQDIKACESGISVVKSTHEPTMEPTTLTKASSGR